MGDSNSSVTRVWPIFDALFKGDPTGREWLQQLICMGSECGRCDLRIREDPGTLKSSLAQFERKVPGNLKKVLGPIRAAKIRRIRNTFESDIPPSEGFLRWLIGNPDQMVWPMKDRVRMIEKEYSLLTQIRRKNLISGDPKARNNALHALSSYGVTRSRRKWWAFEGYTSVDCLLETEKLLVLIEGKRTETVSSATDWFPARNQVIRNLEVARALAGNQRNYAVLICAEENLSLSEESWISSLPHLSESERAELRLHFLGCVKWAEIATKLLGSMRLPNSLDDAVNLCLRLR